MVGSVAFYRLDQRPTSGLAAEAGEWPHLGQANEPAWWTLVGVVVVAVVVIM